MGIARMRAVHNADRYFTITADEYDGHCVRGVMYHGNDSRGVCYDSLMELLLYMDRMFDAMGCPLQTFQMRLLPGTQYPVMTPRSCEEKCRSGKIATFRIYVKYRYNASWQGQLSWLEGERTESFESVLQLIMILSQILSGRIFDKTESAVLNSCHVAIDTYDFGRLTGRLQNIQTDRVVHFTRPEDFTAALGNFIEIGVSQAEPMLKGLNYSQIIANEAWSLCRRGGGKASFYIKILFRKHSTWQGVIYWREARVEQHFRSFKEMLFMIASAVECSSERTEGETVGEETKLLTAGSC